MSYSFIRTTTATQAQMPSGVITLAASPANGNCLIIFSNNSAGAGNGQFTTVTDNGGQGTWTKILTGSNHDNGNSNIWFNPNVAGTTTTVTISFNGGSVPGSVNATVIEYGGFSHTPYIATAPADNSQVNPGTTANAITSATQSAVSFSGPGAAVIGWSFNSGGNSLSAAGTGFTSRLNNNQFGMIEDARVTASGQNQTATFTDSAHGGTSTFDSYVVCFAESYAQIYQERQTSTSTSGPTLALAFSSNVTGNSSIHVVVQALCASAITITVQDNLNGSYTQRGATLNDSTGAGHYFAHYTIDHVLAGATTVTASFTPNMLNAAIWIREVGLTSGFDTHAESVANGIPPTTLSTGNATPSTAPGLISGVASMINSTTQTLSAGSGFTQDVSSAGWLTEELRYTSPTAQAATWGLGGSGGSINVFTVAAFFRESGAPLGAQTASFSRGNIGYGVTGPLTAQTASSSIPGGAITTSITSALGAVSTTFIEGSIPFGPILGSLTATFAEGTITASAGQNPVYALSGQTSQFQVGQLLPGIGYLLDQSTITLVGQTATFAQGSFAFSVNPAITQQTATYSIPAGAVTSALGLNVGSLTFTSSEGVIIANLGNNITNTLGPLLMTSSMVNPTFAPTYTFGANTGTFSEGTVTFSATGDFTVTLIGQPAAFLEGVILPSFAGGMPNVLGMDFARAIFTLEQAGILVPTPTGNYPENTVQVTWQQARNTPPETVIAQFPTPGSAAVQGTQVLLTLSIRNLSGFGTTVTSPVNIVVGSDTLN